MVYVYRSRICSRIGHIEQEMHWAQRAKKDCLSLGDKNTKFFQFATTIHQRKNHIWKILDENGLWSDVQIAIV